MKAAVGFPLKVTITSYDQRLPTRGWWSCPWITTWTRGGATGAVRVVFALPPPQAARASTLDRRRSRRTTESYARGEHGACGDDRGAPDLRRIRRRGARGTARLGRGDVARPRRARRRARRAHSGRPTRPAARRRGAGRRSGLAGGARRRRRAAARARGAAARERRR